MERTCGMGYNSSTSSLKILFISFIDRRYNESDVASVRGTAGILCRYLSCRHFCCSQTLGFGMVRFGNWALQECVIRT